MLIDVLPTDFWPMPASLFIWKWKFHLKSDLHKVEKKGDFDNTFECNYTKKSYGTLVKDLKILTVLSP